MPVQLRQLQFVFVNGLRVQFTTRELLRMFARKESITTLLIWGLAIFFIRPFEPESGYALEARILLWGSLLPLLFGIYLASLIAAGLLFRTGYSPLADLAAALCGGFLMPLAQRIMAGTAQTPPATGASTPGLFDARAFLFLLIAAILLEIVMATYLTYDKRLREERRARERAEAALYNQTLPPSPATARAPQSAAMSDDPSAAAEAQPQEREHPVALLGRPVLLSELLLITAEEHYVRLHTTRGQELLRGRISDLEAQLPEGLGLRVHRSHWVARAAVRKLQRKREGWMLELIDGSEIPVARPRRDSVRDWLAANGIPG